MLCLLLGVTQAQSVQSLMGSRSSDLEVRIAQVLRGAWMDPVKAFARRNLPQIWWSRMSSAFGAMVLRESDQLSSNVIMADSAEEVNHPLHPSIWVASRAILYFIRLGLLEVSIFHPVEYDAAMRCCVSMSLSEVGGRERPFELIF
jgi:hypothetical protein